MSLKQEIETWVTALAAYDNGEYETALSCFRTIADTSKILFNIGIIHATQGEHSEAVECFQRAVQLDQFLAVAYFQQGVSNFLLGDFEEALANFNDTLLYLRGNNNIDYEQLGLKFKLYSCEALFNRGLCYIYLQQKDAGMQDLAFAAREKVVADHDVIDEAIREQAEQYTVFSMPVGVVYRPNEAKVKNLKQKNYLGQARLVAQQDQQRHQDARRALAAIGVDDRPSDKLSYAALNLVRPGLASRSGRQQSEPPMHRDMFPPTPPPELERLESQSREPVYNGMQSHRPAAKPLRLELGAAAFEKPLDKYRKRAESERPIPKRELSNASNKSHDTRRRHHDSDIVQEDPLQAYGHASLSPATSMHHRARSSALRNTQVSIAEEDEEEVVLGEEPLAFEIIPPRTTSRHRSQSRRAPGVRKLRIKVHGEDMRYVMTTVQVQMDELIELVRAKFSLKGPFKLKMKDEEGDMVTMSDQDDLDMALAASGAAASAEKSDMSKMELWVQ